MQAFFSQAKTEYTLHKWKKQLFIADIVLCILIICALIIFRRDLFMIGVYFMLYPYLFFTARKIAFYHLFIASLIALIWLLIAHKQYGYNQNTMVIFGVNTFSFFTWAIGLFGIYLIYSHFEHAIKTPNFMKRIVLFTIIYWILLISAETIAYHLINMRNITTGMYAGLPFCDCIHAPRWMQTVYLSMGPIYFIICELFNLENAHHIKKNSKK